VAKNVANLHVLERKCAEATGMGHAAPGMWHAW